MCFIYVIIYGKKGEFHAIYLSRNSVSISRFSRTTLMLPSLILLRNSHRSTAVHKTLLLLLLCFNEHQKECPYRACY